MDLLKQMGLANQFPLAPPPTLNRPRAHNDRNGSTLPDPGGPEDGATYEAPPIQRAMRHVVPPISVCENVYIERPVPSIGLPKALPKPSVDRMRKPLWNKMVSNAGLQDNSEVNEVYIDPTDDKTVRGSQMNTALFPIPHPPRARPPQPPAQSLKPEDNEEYLNPEELGGMNPFHKSISSNGKTFPMPVVKPPIPNRKSDSVSDLLTKPWYSSKSDRRAAEVALRENGKDGAFLVRPSSGNNRKHPYTLVIFYRRKVYNIPIRFIDRGHQYGLGTEKAGEKLFDSIPTIIRYYQQNSLILIDAQKNSKEMTFLSYPVRL